MKRNILLIPFIAVLTLLIAGFASAELANNIATDFNSVTLGNNTMVGDVDNVIPVRVTFDSIADEENVKVKVYMEGHRDDVSVSTNRFNIEDGITYTKLLSLRLPSDSDDLSEEYTLYVEIVSKDDRTEEEYTISMQRNSYTFEILSIDYSSNILAGEVAPVSVVIKNIGYNRMDDTYAIVSIPALGISSRGYVGDLIPVEDYDDYDDEEDSVQKTVYLKIPMNIEAGVYDMEIEVYNNDAETSVTKLVNIGGSVSGMVLAAVKNQDLNAGETATYDLIVVNSADDVKVFNIGTVSGDVLSVSAPSVVTVGPDASETVSITVKADDNAAIGTYTFSVDVNGKQVVFGANVVGTSVSTSVVALTVILVIIFVVLLAVLVVLLTRKEKPMEEVETSYY